MDWERAAIAHWEDRVMDEQSTEELASALERVAAVRLLHTIYEEIKP